MSWSPQWPLSLRLPHQHPLFTCLLTEMLKIKLEKRLSVHVKADLSLTVAVRDHTVLGRSLGLNGDNVAIGCRQPHSECRHNLYGFTYGMRGPGSVVGIATCYGLDGPGIEFRWGAKFSAPVQTGPGAHPASCTMGTGSFPGVKSGHGVMLTTHPLLVLLVMKE